MRTPSPSLATGERATRPRPAPALPPGFPGVLFEGAPAPSSMEATTILLIDDNETFLHHAQRFLEQTPTFRVVGAAKDAASGVNDAQALQPDVILLDLKMPVLDGFEALPLLRMAAPKAYIVVLSMLEDDGYRARALTTGAHAFVPKSRLVSDLLPVLSDLTRPPRA